MPSPLTPKPTFFESQAGFHTWLEANHDTASECWVGFYKTGSGKPGITYAQALEEALCFGWIDAVRKGIDETRWTIRFTPRKPGSIWSDVNLKKIAKLQAEGLLKPSGLAAFEGRDLRKTKQYSFENEERKLSPAFEKAFRAKKAAWAYFQDQAPSYRRAATFWVMTAKKEETRDTRFAALVESSSKGEWLRHLTPPKKRKKTSS